MSYCSIGIRGLALSGFLSIAFWSYPVNVDFENSSLRVLKETPDRSTGLDQIFIIYDPSNVRMTLNVSNSSEVRIYTYGNRGGGFAEEYKNFYIDNSRIILDSFPSNCGYIIEDGSTRFCFWVVDYISQRFKIDSVAVASLQDCDASVLDFQGYGDAIHYFTINGQQKILSRDIKITYLTQVWNEVSNSFITEEASSQVGYVENSQIRIVPPAYASTDFLVCGDKFLSQWNWMEEQSTSIASPMAIQVRTEAVQDEKNVGGTMDSGSAEDYDENESEVDEILSNEIKTDSDGLGGSAPADIEFNAFVTEGVLHHEWQMSKDADFEEIDSRFREQNLSYTFLDEGIYYVRYVGSNSDGSCEVYGDVYTVTIGNSELLCPNAFSPDGDGVNDEWKVSYRSLLEFKCWIFDRYGAQLFYTENPQLGWDGKKGGKLVSPGVYFYVIQAVGADGKKYKKSGDINILRKRRTSSNGTAE
ncbi:MAG: gliding motility-associated C-terminal domain-containing protein [Bacteroides sp.]|nr:gliding motility-associated C-terminal domain-containing protein [Bacteroides sp.]